MKRVYENSFVHGRELTKKLIAATVASCVLSLAFMGMGNSQLQMTAIAVTTVLFAASIYVIAKYCVCPYCGKRIVLGLLAIHNCPRCKRNLTTGKKSKKR